jgi:integrase
VITYIKTKILPLERTSSRAISSYIQRIPNKRTGIEYLSRLLTFETFIKENYNFSVDELTINKLFNFRENIYDLLSSYVAWLSNRVDKNGHKLEPSSIKNNVILVRTFLESFDIDINQRKFRLNVKLPRVPRQYKKALSKEDITRMLESCSKFKLKVYLLFLASTGARASEAASVRIRDLDFKNSKVEFRAQFTKTGVGRYMYLTNELKEYLKLWIDYKYKERRLYLRDQHINRKIKPNIREDDLVFSSFFTYDGDSYNNSSWNSRKEGVSEQDNVANIYTTLVIDFNRLANQLNFGYENTTKRRHVFTFHSLRRYVKSVISDVISSDFSEWAIGHPGSSYYVKTDEERYSLFKRCEPFLTYLDQTGLNQKQTDLQSRLEESDRRYLELKKDVKTIMEMIQQNPKLANVKPEVLARQKLGKN